MLRVVYAVRWYHRIAPDAKDKALPGTGKQKNNQSIICREYERHCSHVVALRAVNPFQNPNYYPHTQAAPDWCGGCCSVGGLSFTSSSSSRHRVRREYLPFIIVLFPRR